MPVEQEIKKNTRANVEGITFVLSTYSLLSDIFLNIHQKWIWFTEVIFMMQKSDGHIF